MSQVQHIVLYAAKYMDTAATDKYNLHNKKIWNELFLAVARAILIRIANSRTKPLQVVVAYMEERYAMRVNLSTHHNF